MDFWDQSLLDEVEKYSTIILMIALFTSALTPVLSTMYGFVNQIIYSIVGLIF